MLEVVVISVVLVLAAVLLLGVRVFFVKGGQFPNIHIGGSKAMKERGIGCATSRRCRFGNCCNCIVRIGAGRKVPGKGR